MVPIDIFKIINVSVSPAITRLGQVRLESVKNASQDVINVALKKVN